MQRRGWIPWLATLGVGRFPKAPGTWGSLVALLIWRAIPWPSFFAQLLGVILSCLMAWWSIALYEKQTQQHDAKEVVIDEWAGMWITLLGASQNTLVMTLGFLFFRLFDIWKPFPIGWVDRRMHSPLGTLLDDVIAGGFAFLALHFTLSLGRYFAIIHF